jgi:hypothetical protein
LTAPATNALGLDAVSIGAVCRDLIIVCHCHRAAGLPGACGAAKRERRGDLNAGIERNGSAAVATAAADALCLDAA